MLNLRPFLRRLRPRLRRRPAVPRFDPTGLDRVTKPIAESDDAGEPRENFWQRYSSDRARQRGYRIPRELPPW